MFALMRESFNVGVMQDAFVHSIYKDTLLQSLFFVITTLGDPSKKPGTIAKWYRNIDELYRNKDPSIRIRPLSSYAYEDQKLH